MQLSKTPFLDSAVADFRCLFTKSVSLIFRLAPFTSHCPNYSFISTMCNSYNMNEPQISVSGPATAALEKASKKRKLSTLLPTVESSNDTFALLSMFDALTPEEESFPSLNWEFEEAKTEDPIVPVDLGLGGRKRCRTAPGSLSALLRSKSFKLGLSTAEEVPRKSLNSFPDFSSIPEIVPRKSVNKISKLAPIQPVQTFESFELCGC